MKNTRFLRLPISHAQSSLPSSSSRFFPRSKNIDRIETRRKAKEEGRESGRRSGKGGGGKLTRRKFVNNSAPARSPPGRVFSKRGPRGGRRKGRPWKLRLRAVQAQAQARNSAGS